jgi:hypothetical protein
MLTDVFNNYLKKSVSFVTFFIFYVNLLVDKKANLAQLINCLKGNKAGIEITKFTLKKMLYILIILLIK